MSQHMQLRHLWQFGRALALQTCRKIIEHIASGFHNRGFGFGRQNSALTRRAQLKDNRLIPTRLMKSPQGGLGRNGSRRAMSLCFVFHFVTSAIASASVSISACV